LPEKSVGKTLQARVDATTARKFDAVARLRGMTDSQLVRHSIEIMLQHEAARLDEYYDERMRLIQEAREALAG